MAHTVRSTVPSTVRSTGFGAHAHEALRSAVAAAKLDDAMAPVTVIVPSNLCGMIVRRTLAATLTRATPAHATPTREGASGSEPARGVAGITILTLDRLAELVAAPHLTGIGRRPATAPVLVTAWQRELDANPLSFAGVADHPATVTALVETHRRLRDVSPAGLTRIAGVDPLRRDVVVLFDRVVVRVAARCYDVHELRETAAELLAAAWPTPPSTAHDLGAVIVFLPQDLDRSAGRLLAAVSAVAPTTVIAGLAGDPRADRGTVRSLARAGLDGALTTVREPPPTATEVFHASDCDDEVRNVVRMVVAAVRDTPAHRVAVLYGNATPYTRLLDEHFAAARITVNGPGARTAAERVLPRAVLQLLELPSRSFSRAAVFGLLGGAPIRDADGRPVPVSRWERVSRAAGVVGGDDWNERLGRFAAEQRSRAQAEPAGARDWLVERLELEATTAQSLAGFVADLQRRLAAGAAAGSWPALSAWALDTMRAMFGAPQGHRRLPEAETAAGDRLERLLASLAGLAAEADSADGAGSADQADSADGADQADGADSADGASLELLRQLLELHLADDLQRVGRFGTGVLVAPLSAAIGLHADRVFVLGLAEDLCPGRSQEDALLPDEARQASDGELPPLRDRLDVQHRHLLAAFAAAPRVTACFPRGDLRRSSERLPSRWLLDTLRTLTGDTTLATSTWQLAAHPAITGSASYATSIITAAEPATSQEWRQRVLAADPHGEHLAQDDVLARAADLVRGRRSAQFTRFDGNLTAQRASLPDPADGSRVVSATQLQSWVECPHAYLVGRVLGVEPVEDPEERVTISPMDRGSVLHETLDQFFGWVMANGGAPAPDQPWTAPQRRRLQELGAQIGADYAARGLTGHPTLWAQERARLLDDLDRVLTQDESVRRAERRTQVRSELAFGLDRWPEPVVVALPDGRTVRLRGSADRLDETDDDTLVVSDYKSGSAAGYLTLEQLGSDPTAAGTKLQLPVYGYAARLRRGRPTAAVRAEYWFIGPRDRGKRIGIDLTPQVEARFAEVLGVIADGVGGGLFPARAPQDRPWSTSPACAFCDPDGLGAKERRGEWERKKADLALRGYVTLVEGS